MGRRDVKNPRMIQATLHRGKKEVWTRYYARLDTAIRRTVGIAVLEGEPRDVIEFSHREHGFQIGTVKLHTHGRLTVDWAILNDNNN